MESLYLVEWKNQPIFSQLQLEEALLRTDTRNFCVINYGSPKSIVMGLSNQASSLLNISSVQKEQIPVIKRFSGGGTVIVDENTLFITFIFSKNSLKIAPFPEPILRWGAELYSRAWKESKFRLQENDYCIGNRKCGGNAQYIQKDRFLQHTSFLWDYSPLNMQHLLLPPRRPSYRASRPHEEFLTTLKTYGTMQQLVAQLKNEIGKQFHLKEFDARNWVAPNHRQATHYLQM